MKAIAVVLALLSACKLPTKSDSEVLIVGGEPVRETHPAYRSAVAVAELDTGGAMDVYCSGVLVADDLVVTAAHCLNRNPSGLRVYFGDPPRGELRPVVEVRTFRDNYLNGKRLFPTFDIGWIRFSGGLPKEAAPIPILPDTAALTPGLTYSMAGYGDTGSGRHDAGQHKLKTDSVLTWYKEHPQTPGLILYGPTRGKGSCAADSGGPGYVQVDGQWYLAGVNNGKPGHFIGMEQAQCEDGIGIQTSVTFYKAWIEETSGEKLTGPTRPSLAATWPEKIPAHTTFQAWCEDPSLPRPFYEFLQDAADILRVLPSDCTAFEAAFGQREDFNLAISPELLPLLKTLKSTRRLTISLDPPGGAFPTLDVKDLVGFTALEQLLIYANGGEIKNQEMLVQLKALQMLAVRDAAQLKPESLTTLMHLEELRLGNIPLKDLGFAKGLTALKRLDVSFTEVRDVSPLATLTNLEQLDLDQNAIEDVAPIRGLAKLTALSLNNNQIKDVNPLASLANLVSLDLSSNNISDVKPLGVLKNLRTLYLTSNPLKEQVCPVSAGDGARVCLF